MFGKKPEDSPKPVPVYTLTTLPQPFEVVGQVSVSLTRVIGDPFPELVKAAGIEGAIMCADAVLGFVIYSAGANATHIYGMGTAIKYV